MQKASVIIIILTSCILFAEVSQDIIFKNSFEGDLIFSDTFDCSDFDDNDNDGLINCYETNTMVFVDQFNTGTDPNNADTDSDSINDGDEVLGTVNGLNLPAMGLNPLVQNILVEYDWFDDSIDCGSHSHKPTIGVINRVETAFANAPTANPDGSSGIVIIQDYGQGGVFVGGNFIADTDGVIVSGVGGPDFHDYKDDNFASNRDGYFHYTLFPHRYNTNSSSSGQAEVFGDDLIVSLYCAHSDRNVANTILHEIGHNFTFRHGGDQNCNFKPNYNSVMNYKFQFPGADNDCDGFGDGILDYSRGFNSSLDENDLDENEGICDNQAIDWNNDSSIDASISSDINSSDGNQNITCSGIQTTISDYNDWANLVFSGINDFDRNFMEIVNCNNHPD